jgi:hypothetical protein
MDLFNANATPAYKGTSQQSQAATSSLSGFGSLLLGGSQASYKTVNGASASAPAPAPAWWQFWSTAAPVYKTAPAVDPSGAVTADNGDTDVTDDCDDAQGMTTQVVIL